MSMEHRSTTEKTKPKFNGLAVAVLPFACVGDISEVEHLADGITEEVRTGLCLYDGLAVIGHQSTLRYRDMAGSPEEVNLDLGARFVVTGSVRRIGDSLRVATQLTDAANPKQLWAETQQQQFSVFGLLQIQEKIVRQVVIGIGSREGVELVPIRREPRGKPPKELSAYEASFRFYHYIAVHGQEAHTLACRALERAIEEDYEYALGSAQLSELYCDVPSLGYEGPDDALERARTCAQRAVDLDNLCQHARIGMAYVSFLDGEHSEVIRQTEMAIALNPNHAYLVSAAGFLMGLSGNPEAGSAIIKEMEILNPRQPGWMRMVAFLGHIERSEYDAALEEARQVRFPQLAWDPLLRASAAALADEVTEAISAQGELKELFPEVALNPEPYVRAFYHSDLGAAKTLEGLEKARKLAEGT